MEDGGLVFSFCIPTDARLLRYRCCGRVTQMKQGGPSAEDAVPSAESNLFPVRLPHSPPPKGSNILC